MIRPRQFARLLRITQVFVRHDLDEFVTAIHLFRPYRLLLRLAPWRLFARRGLARGVRLTGTDAWSWDAPFVHTATKYAETGNAALIWEGHKAGRDIGYCHLEKLHNLESLPGDGFTIACLSWSLTETNTTPSTGTLLPAPSCDLAKARPKSMSRPMTSPVERISGPSTESTICPSFVRNRLKGSTASLTETGESSGTREPSEAGSRPSVFSSSIVVPVMMRAAAFASEMPRAFETNGTVRLARGFASMT